MIYELALLALCAAYIQGPLVKMFDYEGAVAEMVHFLDCSLPRLLRWLSSSLS